MSSIMREDWVECELGEMCDIISGKNQRDVLSTDGKYPIYGSAGIFGRANSYICEAGTTIIGRKGTINSPIYVNERFWNVDTAFGISPLFLMDNKYVHFFCLGFNFKKLDRSTTIPSLAKTDIAKITFPLAPLPIQRAIVSKIESLFSDLDNGIANLKKAQAQLKVYRQAVLKKAFEGELTKAWREGLVKTQDIASQLPTAEDNLPKGWKWVKLKDISELITDGDHQAPPKSEEGIPFITISSVNKTSNKINFENTFKVKSEYYYGLKEHRKPKYGDILYTVTGSFGIPIIIDFEKEFCFQRHIGLIRPLKSVNQKYLYYLLQTKAVFNQASETATGTAQKTVALSSLRNFTIPFCNSLQEQTQIVAEIESRLSVCDKMEQSITESLAKAEALRQSILKKAFEGKLLSAAEIAQCKQEPDYEPASELLKKIQAEKWAKEQKNQKSKKNGK